MGSGSPGAPHPLIHMEQPRGLVFSCPLWSCFVRCDLGSPGQLAAAGQEKPVSCACSQERSYIASIFASSSGEGQGSGAMYPGSQRKLIPVQSVKRVNRLGSSWLLVNTPGSTTKRNHPVYWSTCAKGAEKTGQSYLLIL